MAFPKTLQELEDKIVKIWNATIESLRRKLSITEVRVEVAEEDISALEFNVEENTEDILATKAELQEVRDLLIILVQDLASKGLVDDPRLLQLLNEEILILQ